MMILDILLICSPDGQVTVWDTTLRMVNCTRVNLGDKHSGPGVRQETKLVVVSSKFH